MALGDPFATATDLASRLKVSFDAAATEQVEDLLADASNELRGVIGQPINRGTSTVTLVVDRHERVDLPAVPVVSVASVTHDGVAVAGYTVRGRTLIVPGVHRDEELVVTYTHGWDPIPGELVRWTCVLAAASLAAVNTTGALGMTAGVVSGSEGIDDYQRSWQGHADVRMADHGMTLPQRVQERLRAMYGATGVNMVVFERER